MPQKRRVLEFGKYDKSAKLRVDDPDSYGDTWHALKYRCLLSCLEAATSQPGSKEHRKLVKEIRRKLRKIGEVPDADQIRVLAESGGVVQLLQSELDTVRKLWDRFVEQAQFDVEWTTAVDEMLDNAPEVEVQGE